MGTSRSPTTVMTWRPTARCKRQKQRFSSKNWTHSWRLCFLKKHPRSFSLWGSWVFMALDQRSKTTSHQKGHENWLQKIKLCASRCPWFYPRVPLQRPDLLHHRIPYLPKADTPENPVPERSRSTSEELRWNLQHRPKEDENKNKNVGHEEVQCDLLHDLARLASRFQREFGRWE